MWISRTYDKFQHGFPVKPSLPGLDFFSKFTKILCGFPVPFIKQKHVLHKGGMDIFLHWPILANEDPKC